jgi:hypothetical protein
VQHSSPRSTARRFTVATVVAALAAAALALSLPLHAHAARADMAPVSWAQRFCSAVVDWSDAAQVKEQALEKNIDPTSLPRSRAVFSRFLDQMVGETDRMITRIDAAGTPAVRSGPAIRAQLRAVLLRARGALADARRSAAAMSLTNRTAFAKSATAIGDTINVQFGSIGKAFDRIDATYPSPELDHAFTQAPACKTL